MTFKYFQGMTILNIIPILNSSLFLLSREQVTTLYVLTICKIYALPLDVIKSYLQEAWFLAEIRAILLKDYNLIMDSLRQRSEETAKVGLARFLLEHALADEKGNLVLHAYFTYEEIGAFLDIHPVSVARLVQDMQKSNLLIRRGKALIIPDKSALTELLLAQD